MSRRTPESPVVEGVMDFLEAVDGHKVIVFRRQAGGLSYKKGLPDVYATVDGIHVEVECKAPAGSRPPTSSVGKGSSSKPESCTSGPNPRRSSSDGSSTSSDDIPPYPPAPPAP